MDFKTEHQNFLILNNVRSCYNVGACMRVCDSINIGIIFQGITPYPINKKDKRLPYVANKTHLKIKKTATESINNVYFKYFVTPNDTIKYLKKNNIELYTLETNIDNSKNLFNNKLVVKSPFALVVGNEKRGVDYKYVKSSKACFYIPMLGKNKSLNVSTAAAVAMYQLIVKN